MTPKRKPGGAAKKSGGKAKRRQPLTRRELADFMEQLTREIRRLLRK